VHITNSSRAWSFAKTSFRGFRFLKKKRKPRKLMKTFHRFLCWVPKPKNAFIHIHTGFLRKRNEYIFFLEPGQKLKTLTLCVWYPTLTLYVWSRAIKSPKLKRWTPGIF
jgi:hypothetical protein